MRNDLIELLALLVSVGYIKSFRVTKNYISGAICSGDAGGKESKNHGRARKGNDGQKDKKAGRSSPAAKEI